MPFGVVEVVLEAVERAGQWASFLRERERQLALQRKNWRENIEAVAAAKLFLLINRRRLPADPETVTPALRKILD